MTNAEFEWRQRRYSQPFLVSRNRLKRALVFLAGLTLPWTALSIGIGPIYLQVGLVFAAIAGLACFSNKLVYPFIGLASVLLLLTVFNAFFHGFDAKLIYFVVSHLVAGMLLFGVMNEPSLLHNFGSGFLAGVIVSALLGAVLCMFGSCGFGTDPNFAQMTSSVRLFGLNAEASILTGQLIACIGALFVVMRVSSVSLNRVTILVFFAIFLLWTQSTQLILLFVVALIAIVPRDRGGNFTFLVPCVALVGFLLIPLLFELLRVLAEVLSMIPGFERDLYRDVVASGEIRFASMKVGWSLLLSNLGFGIGFDRFMIADNVALIVAWSENKAGVDNYVLARSVEFGIVYLIIWMFGFVRLCRFNSTVMSYKSLAPFLFSSSIFLFLLLTSTLSSGYLGLFYYSFAFAFAFAPFPSIVNVK